MTPFVIGLITGAGFSLPLCALIEAWAESRAHSDREFIRLHIAEVERIRRERLKERLEQVLDETQFGTKIHESTRQRIRDLVGIA